MKVNSGGANSLYNVRFHIDMDGNQFESATAAAKASPGQQAGPFMLKKSGHDLIVDADEHPDAWIEFPPALVNEIGHQEWFNVNWTIDVTCKDGEGVKKAEQATVWTRNTSYVTLFDLFCGSPAVGMTKPAQSLIDYESVLPGSQAGGVDSTVFRRVGPSIEELFIVSQ